MNRPVLIAVTKEGCPACSTFKKKYWSDLLERLAGRIRVTEININRNNPSIPEPLRDYVGFFPSFILFSPSSFYSLYTYDMKERGKTRGKGLRGIVYSAIKSTPEDIKRTGIPWIPFNKPLTSESIECWALNNAKNASSNW